LALAFALLYEGCGAPTRFYAERPRQPKDVLQRLIDLAAQIDGYRMNATLMLTVDDKQLQIPLKITFASPNSYSIVAIGPLGMKIARIEVEGDSYTVSLPQMGQTLEGTLDDALTLPGAAFEFPNMRDLIAALSPYPVLRTAERWLIDESSSMEAGRLILKRPTDDWECDLGFTVEPFQVYRETWRREGRLILQRLFQYRGEDDSLPDRITIRIEDRELAVDIEDLDVQWRVGA